MESAGEWAVAAASRIDELGPLVAAKKVERPSPFCPLLERVEDGLLLLLEAEAHEPPNEVKVEVQVEGPEARAEMVEA